MGFSAIDLVYDFCFMSALLIVAKIIRVKLKLIQRLYIPSALIAGFLGLFLGKEFLNIVSFSDHISDYAGILIVILFASMFLGNNKKIEFNQVFKRVGDTFLVNGAAEIAQFGIFILIGLLLLPSIFPGINKAFGLMLPSGFVGGHGTAAAIGSVLSETPWNWNEAVSVGQTFATIGLLGGIIIGIVIINIGTRRGYTKIVKDVKALPKEMLTGLNDASERHSIGDETINAMSMDTITFHLSLILLSSGLAYFVNRILRIFVPNLSIPTYGLALICSVFVQWLLKQLKLDPYIDRRIVTHIGSTATDYLVAFGVASIDINEIIKYLAPIILLSVFAFLVIIIWLFTVNPHFFKSYWFERGIYIFGMSTGVLATGVLLLRIVDPKFESGVLEDFGIAWIGLSVLDMLIVSFSPLFVIYGYGVEYSLFLLIISTVMLAICHKIYPK